jgi:hypothetical protein
MQKARCLVLIFSSHFSPVFVLLKLIRFLIGLRKIIIGKYWSIPKAKQNAAGKQANREMCSEIFLMCFPN